jgi:hypothetical protein
MANLKLNSGESIIFESPGSYVYDNNTSEAGRCLLTSQRVIFCKHSMPGFLVNLFKLKANNLMIEIPINSVLSLTQSQKASVKGGTFHVVHTVGEYDFTFLLANKHNVRWITGFQSAIEKGNPGAQMLTRDNGFDVVAAA